MSSLDLTRKPSVPQEDPPRSPRETLPTMYDLPSEFPEEPGLPDEFHDLQPQLLTRTLCLGGYDRQNYFTGSDLNIYYTLNHPLWHKRPDWFLAVGVPRLYDGSDLRRSFVTWQEQAAPYVVVEFLSPGTEREDLGRFYDEATAADFLPDSEQPDNGQQNPPGKLDVYERYLRVPHYIVYSRYTQQLRYFKLTGGHYQEQALRSGPCRIWLDDLQIGLGVWEGEFDELLHRWLRWCDEAGNWFLTDTEQAYRAIEVAQAQLLQAARNLLDTGMPVEQVAEILALTAEQRQQLDNHG